MKENLPDLLKVWISLKSDINWKIDKPFNFKPNKKIKKISINASKLVNADYAGIDIIEDNKNNYKVIEINSVPAWKALQKITKKSIALILAKAFIKKLK